jgi:transketolase
VKDICKKIRKDIIRIAKESGHGHIPTCFSIIEMLYALYSIMRHDPADPSWKERDLFVLSKAHAALAHYCVLSEFGYFDKERIRSFGAFQSDFGCHADRSKVPGIEVSTGSLGHGIGVAVGLSLAVRLKKSHRKVYTIIGDGEANEGSVWEAVMVAVNLNMDHFTILYDNNMSHERGLQIKNPAANFHSFGCDVLEVDGHDLEALKTALLQKSDTVKVIVARTRKGFGCRTLCEHPHEWHRRSPDEKEFALLMGELDAETI